MEREDKNYLGYSATKTYSLKISNIMKIDKLAEEKKIDKSKALNVIIENYCEEKMEDKKE